MALTSEFSEIFGQLVRIMRLYGCSFVCVKDDDSEYLVNTRHVKNRKPRFFGAVQTYKHYLSYQLMPVYVLPDPAQGHCFAIEEAHAG